MGNDPWQALDARVHPPFSGYGDRWHLAIDLPEGPELGDDHKAGLLSAWGVSLSELLARTELLVSLLGWKGTLTLLHGAYPNTEDAPVLGFMDFAGLDPLTHLTAAVLEDEFKAQASAFRGRFNVVPRAIDAYRRNRDRPDPPQGPLERRGQLLFGKNPTGERFVLYEHTQTHEAVRHISDFLDDQDGLTTHLASNMLLDSIEHIVLTSDTTYTAIKSAMFNPNTGVSEFVITDDDNEIDLRVSIEALPRV